MVGRGASLFESWRHLALAFSRWMPNVSLMPDSEWHSSFGSSITRGYKAFPVLLRDLFAPTVRGGWHLPRTGSVDLILKHPFHNFQIF